MTLADRKIDAQLFNKSHARYKADLERLDDELSRFTSQVSDYQRFLKQGLSVVGDLSRLYQKGNLGQKRAIIGSIFPEKVHIDKTKSRTAFINEALRLILATDKDLEQNKTGQLFKNLELSGNVEVTGIEPVSKYHQAKELYLIDYLLIIST